MITDIAIRVVMSVFFALGFLHIDRPPVSNASGPLVGEFASALGSRMTFADDGDNNWSSGYVLVEFAADAEYLLEGRENNTTYRYLFGFKNGNADYDIADKFELSNGVERFARCFSRYAGDVLLLDPIRPDGEKLEFVWVTVSEDTIFILERER